MSFIRLFLFLALILVVGNTYGQSSAELKRRKDALTREIEMLRRSQNEVASNKRLSLKQINALNAQIRLREEKIKTINSEVRLLDNEISENTSTVRSLQSQLNKLKKEYAAMVLFAFRNQSAYSKLMFVFASKDFNQAYKRLKYLQQFGDYRKKQAKYIEQTSKELGIKIVQLDRNKRSKNDLLHDQEDEKITLGKEKNTKAQQFSKLSKQEKKLRQELSKKQREAASLNRAINNAIAREIAEARRREEEAARAAAAKAKAENREVAPAKPASRGSSVLASTPEAAKLSSDFLGNRGGLPWPVANGSITERFGRHTVGAGVVVDNDGVTIRTNQGAAIRAVFEGTVAQVGTIPASNVQYILVRHGEYFSVYSGLKSVSVSRGQKVSVKQTIGVVSTDSEDGTTEMQFKIWKGSTPLNPESWLAN
ncbi:murein hydrolase activator EnvC family protein [Desertivirga xinjiangensis]|uniref:murein hydrolase activator EnvC family protein n=1 Tax=Desertivirga xinjiangensis TaxID=539206 RepID=UPI00210EB9A8|nr:peptidoglycan DD-metalloendopeptidase family protein [Pedobacter xinjiangensis]